MKKYIPLLLTASLLGGCWSPAPEKPLVEMAKALEERDAQRFLAQMDSTRFAASMLKNRTENNEPMRLLDSLGKSLGIGGISDLLNSVIDVEQQEKNDFARGVGSGELMHQCRQARRSGCPWVPESLLNATVREISSHAAVAKVTTPVGMTTWLALAKEGDTWKVVGQSPVEADALLYAKGATESAQEKNSSPAEAPTPPPHTPHTEQKKDTPVPPPPVNNSGKDDLVRL